MSECISLDSLSSISAASPRIFSVAPSSLSSFNRDYFDVFGFLRGVGGLMIYATPFKGWCAVHTLRNLLPHEVPLVYDEKMDRV